jgi:FkbM family methyltransferase
MASFLKKILTQTIFKHLRSSYSQSGEDIIISDLFSRLGISQPTYLDIGANEPISLNNTYRLYKRGSRGVCVEPNPIMYKKLRKERKKDVCLNMGVAFNEQREADFYVFPEKWHGLNTFSKKEAEFWEQTGNKDVGKFKVEQVIKMQLIDINELMEKYFSPWPNLISLDVEGLDLEIVKTIDWEKYKPEVICVETLWFGEGDKELKNTAFAAYIESKGYFAYADTYINTIFCRKDAYKNKDWS